MNARAINLPVVAVVNGEATTTSLAIADGTEIQHKNVMELVRTYKADLEEFGPVAFETRKGEPLPQGGFAKAMEFAILNEPQSTLIMTYMRNSDIVRTFKKRLVKEFWELARAAHAERAKEPRALMEAAIRKFLEGKPKGVSTTKLGNECFNNKAPLPLAEVLEGLVAAGVLAMEEVPRTDGNPGKPTRLWRLAHLPKNALRQLEPPLVKLPNPDSLMEQCKRFIADLVALGPVDAEKAMAACEAAGFTQITVRRAKKTLGLPSRKTPESVYSWEWAKPDEADRLWLTVTPAELDRLVRQGAQALLARAAGGEAQAIADPLHGARMVVRFEAGGHYTVEPVDPGDHILNMDEYAELYDIFLAREGKVVVAQAAVDAIRQIAALNLGV
jgi:phage regulator Rha-like protein